MKPLFYVLFLLALTINAQVKPDFDYYFGSNLEFEASISTPSSVVGFQVGEWHISHDKLAHYMQVLASESPRIRLENRGSTFEGRPLQLLTITSEENHKRLEEIRQNHVSHTNSQSGSTHSTNRPVVIYQGFSIHGNEPSGSNAALLLAYYLAAAQSTEVKQLLNEAVILLDPSFNPDGLQRFAYWANTNKSENLISDRNDREYHEVWPGGRTNHYWFDMNRDWLPVQLPESRARIKTFHHWMPNILTDHHEMGTNATFFFQPGVPDRVHPLTPQRNQELTTMIADFHKKAFNKIGSLYYSEENFDDFYYGKGSTFPDINGGIGILFEQASSRGHYQESENGILSFPFTIKNQLTAALSTLEAGLGLKNELLEYQYQFYQQSQRLANASKSGAIIFGDPADRARAAHLVEILKRHQIKVYRPESELTINKKKYPINSSYIVPLKQKHHRLIKAMFEKRTSFKDSLFYDVSAWSFPLAFNLNYDQTSSSNLGDEVKQFELPQGSIDTKSNTGYLFEWHEYYTPLALNKILQKGLRAKVAMEAFELEGKKYDYGSIFVPTQNQKLNTDALFLYLKEVAQEAHITITAAKGSHAQGIDLGSNLFKALKTPKVGIITGWGLQPYDVGEIWHLFDQRYKIPLTKLDRAYLNKVDLSRYNTLILTHKNASLKAILGYTGLKKLKQWVKNGGTLIGFRNAALWLKQNNFIEMATRGDTLKAKSVLFKDKQRFKGAQHIGGAIFKTRIDRSHPINFGISGNELALFRNTSVFIEPDENSFENPIIYTDDALLSGYISEENYRHLIKSVPFKVKPLGKGKVLVFTDNTQFRAFWYGTNKLLMNAVFFARFM